MDEIKLTRTYLDQLREQQATIEQFLQVQQPDQLSEGVRLTMDIYTNILEDASKTLTSLIQYFERPSSS